MPSRETLSLLREAFQKIELLPNKIDVWDRINLITQFYMTYSHKKSKFSDAETFLEVMQQSASGEYSQQSIARAHDANVSNIINSWDIMHVLMTICLSARELNLIGITPARLPDQALHIRELYLLYSGIKPCLETNEEIKEVLWVNNHYTTFLRYLSEGKGIKAFMMDFVGPEYEYYFPRISYVESDFRRGLGLPETEVADNHDSKYNYSFLRRAALARYVINQVSSQPDESMISASYFNHTLRRILSISSNYSEYVTILQEFIRKLPYYDSALAKDPNYRAELSTMSLSEYLDMNTQHNSIPYPIRYILEQEAYGVTQTVTAAEMNDSGIAYAKGTLRNEISSVGRFAETVMLTPKLGMMTYDSFLSALSRSHKQDIARITEVAAGRPDPIGIES